MSQLGQVSTPDLVTVGRGVGNRSGSQSTNKGAGGMGAGNATNILTVTSVWCQARRICSLPDTRKPPSRPSRASPTGAWDPILQMGDLRLTALCSFCPPPPCSQILFRPCQYPIEFPWSSPLSSLDLSFPLCRVGKTERATRRLSALTLGSHFAPAGSSRPPQQSS